MVHFKVYEKLEEMRLELLNEFTVLVTVYILLMFAGDFVPNGQTHNDIGSFMINMTLASFILSGLNILYKAK